MFPEHPEELEQVVECQSPLFLTVEWEEGAVPGPGAPVRLFFSAPAEAELLRTGKQSRFEELADTVALRLQSLDAGKEIVGRG